MTIEHSSNLIGRLRNLRDSCGEGSNKHDLAIVLISACLDEGVNTKTSIIGVLTAVGFNPKHVAIVLKNETGNNPASSRWRIDDEGRHSLLEEVAP